MWGSPDWVLPAPRVGRTAWRGLPAQGRACWRLSPLASDGSSWVQEWSLASVGGRGQRIKVGQSPHSPCQRQTLALNEAPLRLRGTVQITGVTPGCYPSVPTDKQHQCHLQACYKCRILGLPPEPAFYQGWPRWRPWDSTYCLGNSGARGRNEAETLRSGRTRQAWFLLSCPHFQSVQGPEVGFVSPCLQPHLLTYEETRWCSWKPQASSCATKPRDEEGRWATVIRHLETSRLGLAFIPFRLEKQNKRSEEGPPLSH